jgi:hypothetical protein
MNRDTPPPARITVEERLTLELWKARGHPHLATAAAGYGGFAVMMVAAAGVLLGLIVGLGL